MRRSVITSSNNGNVKAVVALQKKGKIRKEQDAFVVEGIKMVSEIPKDNLLQLYVSERFLLQQENVVYLEEVALEKKANYEVVSDRVFQEMTDTQTPQGVLAVVRQSHYSLSDLFSENKVTHILVLEDIQDPGNLGTILRAGEGAGITGIVMSKGTVDIYNPKVIRSTMGSIYRVPFFYTENLKEILCEIKKECTIYAAHLNGQSAYDKADYTKPLALLIGNEANGLSEEISSWADCFIRIPMQGKVESLNAAVAASVLMYEVYRQRRQKEENGI